MKKNFSFKNADKIKSFLKNFNHFGVKHFVHDITFSQGRIAMLSDNEEIISHYLKNEIPAICTNNDGRELDAGAYLDQTLVCKYKDCAQLIPQVKRQFKITNTIHIAEREQDCQHFYTFGFNIDKADFVHHIINNINELFIFINSYKHAAKDIISEAKKPKNQIILPISSNIIHDKNSIKNYNDFICEANKTLIQVVHKDTNAIINLSFQQSRCLKLLLNGYSAKEIAKNISLSYRTVEHYLENIRKLLGCRSSKELVAAYFSQV